MHVRRPAWDPVPPATSQATPRLSLWRRICAYFDHQRRQRLAAQELALLNHHMLTDIGLTRWDIVRRGAHCRQSCGRDGRFHLIS
ncbi:hypothetical protein HB662_20520 [Roseomonas frigidaquae]|uniref:DUF1127 domain-containing protein n=1 Tax=Falsiroseomonas frigidaquae TaxID=487318 RepID=A0ABX1F494_9PROT|nr:hypothetical protein [Falsiroseomonas frigidaquae]NKE47175.1 hypothetical protein [Falsiroseomonas frigidaquae]